MSVDHEKNGSVHQDTDQKHESETTLGMESVHRITKLPVVESTINTATSIYSKVKDYNSVTQWTLSTAEGTVHKAVEIGNSLATPVVSHLQQPIKKVDGLLCTGLDYVEEKIPAIKLPPGEMYTGAKTMVSNTVEGARHYVEPAVETAKHMVEPAVETAKHLVEPAVEKACALKDFGAQQVDKFLHSQISHAQANGSEQGTVEKTDTPKKED